MTPITAPSRYAVLDGLRGIAALVVVCGHLTWPSAAAPASVAHGALAVDFFFVLSGFVIAHGYDARLASRALSLRGFAALRLIRLYPMVAVGTMLGAAVLCGRIAAEHDATLVRPLLAALAFAALLLPSQVFDTPGLALPFPLNGPSWSLSFEIVADIAYAAIASTLTTTRLAAITAVLGIGLGVEMVCHGGIYGGNVWTCLLAGFWRVGFSFGAGLLVFRAGRAVSWSRQGNGLAWLLGGGLALALLCPTPPGWRYDGVCVFVVFPLIVAAGARLRVTPPLARLWAWVGRLSYPLYLSHDALVRVTLRFVRRHDLHGAALALTLTAAVVASVLLAAVCLLAIDEPVRAALARWRRPAPARRLEQAA